MSTNSLTRVRRASTRRTSSEAEWRAAIREARATGESLRRIAAAAGISHVRVIQLLREN